MNAHTEARLATSFNIGDVVEIAARYDRDTGEEIDALGCCLAHVVAIAGTDVEVEVVGTNHETFVTASRLRRASR